MFRIFLLLVLVCASGCAASRNDKSSTEREVTIEVVTPPADIKQTKIVAKVTAKF